MHVTFFKLLVSFGVGLALLFVAVMLGAFVYQKIDNRSHDRAIENSTAQFLEGRISREELDARVQRIHGE
jgi:uncharacterized membrane protein YukC